MVNRGTVAVSRCTAVYCDVIAVHHDNFHPGSYLLNVDKQQYFVLAQL